MRIKHLVILSCALLFSIDMAYSQTRSVSYSTEESSGKKVDGVPYASYVLSLNNFESNIQELTSSIVGQSLYAIDISKLDLSEAKIQAILELGRNGDFTDSVFDKEAQTITVKTNNPKASKNFVANKLLWQAGLR